MTSLNLQKGVEKELILTKESIVINKSSTTILFQTVAGATLDDLAPLLPYGNIKADAGETFYFTSTVDTKLIILEKNNV